MSMIASGKALQRRPGLDRDLAIRLGRKAEDDFTRVDRAVDPGQPLGRPLLRYDAVELLEQIDFMVGVPGHALAAIAELVHQRPERGEPLMEVRIVALDH